MGGGYPPQGMDKSPRRVQNGVQATTAALAVIGVAIEDVRAFEVSGWLSLNNMAAGDRYDVFEEVRDGDDVTYRQYGFARFFDVQESPMIQFEKKILQGWRVRIIRVTGVDRNVTYQYFRRW